MRKNLLDKQAAMKASQPKRRGPRAKALGPKIVDVRPRSLTIAEQAPKDRDLLRDLRLFSCNRMLRAGVPVDQTAKALTQMYGEPVSVNAIERWVKAGRPCDLDALD